MDQRYPELCPIFNGITTKELAAEVNETFTVAQFFASFDLSDEELFQFKHQLMEYATDNLVKINAFMDSPYLSKYQTDEVAISVVLHIIFFHFGVAKFLATLPNYR